MTESTGRRRGGGHGRWWPAPCGETVVPGWRRENSPSTSSRRYAPGVLKAPSASVPPARAVTSRTLAAASASAVSTPRGVRRERPPGLGGAHGRAGSGRSAGRCRRRPPRAARRRPRSRPPGRSVEYVLELGVQVDLPEEGAAELEHVRPEPVRAVGVACKHLAVDERVAQSERAAARQLQAAGEQREARLGGAGGERVQDADRTLHRRHNLARAAARHRVRVGGGWGLRWGGKGGHGTGIAGRRKGGPPRPHMIAGRVPEPGTAARRSRAGTPLCATDRPDASHGASIAARRSQRAWEQWWRLRARPARGAASPQRHSSPSVLRECWAARSGSRAARLVGAPVFRPAARLPIVVRKLTVKGVEPRLASRPTGTSSELELGQGTCD